METCDNSRLRRNLRSPTSQNVSKCLNFRGCGILYILAQALIPVQEHRRQRKGPTSTRRWHSVFDPEPSLSLSLSPRRARSSRAEGRPNGSDAPDPPPCGLGSFAVLRAGHLRRCSGQAAYRRREFRGAAPLRSELRVEDSLPPACTASSAASLATNLSRSSPSSPPADPRLAHAPSSHWDGRAAIVDRWSNVPMSRRGTCRCCGQPLASPWCGTKLA